MRVAIVEDEPLAARALRELLRDDPTIDIVDEISDGRSAIARLNASRPDLVFLDIRLPEINGIDVLRALEYAPLVVFTTAYDDFAITAFELAAIDYLLKPFGAERLRRTLDRVRRLMHAEERHDISQRASAALDTSAPMQRLLLREHDTIIPVDVADIERFEANDDYVTVFARGRRYLAAVSMTQLESRLSPQHFTRVHRSHIVNLDHVATIEAYDGSRLLIVLRSGTKLIASRSASRILRSLTL